MMELLQRRDETMTLLNKELDVVKDEISGQIHERHLRTSENLTETPCSSYDYTSEFQAKSKRIQQQLDRLEEFRRPEKNLKQVLHWERSNMISPIPIRRTNVLPTTIWN